MAAPRFNFSVRNLLWATLWLSIWGGSFSFLRLFKQDRDVLPHTAPMWMQLVGLWVPAFLIVWSPVVVVSALFNCTKGAMLIGLAIAGITLASLGILFLISLLG